MIKLTKISIISSRTQRNSPAAPLPRTLASTSVWQSDIVGEVAHEKMSPDNWSLSHILLLSGSWVRADVGTRPIGTFLCFCNNCKSETRLVLSRRSRLNSSLELRSVTVQWRNLHHKKTQKHMHIFSLFIYNAKETHPVKGLTTSDDTDVVEIDEFPW